MKEPRNLFSLKKILEIDRKNWFSLFSIFFAIIVYVYITAIMATLVKESASYNNLYEFLRAAGLFVTGFLSDKYCRRRTALLAQGIGLIVLLGIWLFPINFPMIFIFAFFYSPSAVIKATLIDDFPQFSKMYLIAAAFILQAFPWCFYHQMVLYNFHQLLLSGVILLAISMLISTLFFYDRRDFLLIRESVFSIHSFCHKNGKRAFIYTMAAFIPAQSVYLISGYSLDFYTDQTPVFYSILAAGGLFGAFLALLYKKTPHIAFLTIIYGISFTVAAVPLVCIYFLGYESVNPALRFMIFSCLSSFSLPFVFDVVLSAVNVNYRGLTCAMLEALYSITWLGNLAFEGIVRLTTFMAFCIIIGLYGTAMILQKRAE